MNCEWIPAEEELPELDKWVLCCSSKHKIIDVLKRTSKGWETGFKYRYLKNFVTAWMPLPEVYDPEKIKEKN